MTKEEITKALQEDANDNNGEILEVRDDGILYYDYDSSLEVFYRFEDSCTKELLESKIIIGKKVLSLGITPKKIAEMLFDAFSDEIKDAMCTLGFIGIFFGRDDFDEIIERINSLKESGEDLCEWVEYDEFENLCGKMLYAHQLPMICVDTICKCCVEEALEDEKILGENYEERFDAMFAGGIGSTIIHEVRHCMMDTNLFLSEDKYPKEEQSEESVEMFGQERYRTLPANAMLETSFIAPRDFKADFEVF